MSTAANIPQSFFPVDLIDAEALRSLHRSHFLVLSRLAGLMAHKSKRAPSGKPYALPGQRWLSKVTGLRRETVSRAVRHLQALGYINITRRRRLGGRWQTNLYKPGPNVLRAMGLKKQALVAAVHRVTSRSQTVLQDSSTKAKAERERGPRTVSDHIARLKSIFDGG